MRDDPIFIITRGINDDLVDFAFSLDDAFRVVSERYTPDEILLHVIEIKSIYGDTEYEKLTSLEVYQMIREQGYYSE